MQHDDIIPGIPAEAPRDLFDGITVFLRVVRHCSFRAAAEELGMSQSAVGQSIRALERRVGVPLLARTTRRVGLTEAGEIFLPHACAAVRSLEEGICDLERMTKQVSGTLRLSMPRAVSNTIAPLLLNGFCARHPDMEIELHAEDRVVDLVEEGFDAGLRIGEHIARDMVAVRISPPFPFVVVGSPDYLARHGTPGSPEDLTRHRCIRYSRATDRGVHRWDFVRGERRFSLAVRGGPIINDSHLNILAAQSGSGLAYTALPLVDALIRQGQLVSVLEGYLPVSDGLFICYPSRRQSLPKLRAFVAFAREHFQLFNKQTKN